MIEEVRKSQCWCMQCVENKKKRKSVEEITQLIERKAKTMIKELKVKRTFLTIEL